MNGNAFLALSEVLYSGGAIVANKALLRAIGIDETLLYSELLSRWRYFAQHGQLTDDGYFYNTVDDLEAATTIGERRQRKAIKSLENLGLIEQKNIGVPQKRHFKIIEDAEVLIKLIASEKHQRTPANGQLGQNGLTVQVKTAQLYRSKRPTNNNNLISITNKEEHKSLSSCAETAEKVIAYLNEKAGTKYRASTKATQRLISARLVDGFTLSDFEKVIDSKVAQWKDDAKMCAYLRPSTLFGGKMEEYLHAPTAMNKPQTKAEAALAERAALVAELGGFGNEYSDSEQNHRHTQMRLPSGSLQNGSSGNDGRERECEDRRCGIHGPAGAIVRRC